MSDEALDYRVPDDAERAEMHEILCHAFAVPSDSELAWLELVGHDNLRMLRGPDGVRACLGVVPMGQFLGGRSVAIEGIVEYKHWLWDALVDINVLTWGGPDRATVVATAERELRSLREYLAGQDDVLPDDGSVRVASLISTIAAANEPIADTRARVSHMLGRLLASTEERPLSAHDSFSADETGPPPA